MVTCSSGHESEWEDYCSVCGESLGGTALGAESSPAAPVASATQVAEASKSAEPAGPTCANCGEPHTEGDVFCENCGYDFLSGTLPGEETSGASSASGQPENAGVAATSVAVVEVDLEFFERMAFTGIEAPSDLPEPVRIALPPTDILVGRHSESRGTFPEIDLSTVFGDGSPATDPAVSSSHCRLHRSSDGWTLTDLDSTNGTYLDASPDPLTPGKPMSLIPGTPFNVGAWTRIVVISDPPTTPS